MIISDAQTADAGLRRLLDDGYAISLTKDPAGCVASVSGPRGCEHDAIAATPEAALAAAAPCPAWCQNGEPGHDHHSGIHALDDDTVLIARGPDGALTAELIGAPGSTAEGSVVLSAAAFARMTEILAAL